MLRVQRCRNVENIERKNPEPKILPMQKLGQNQKKDLAKIVNTPPINPNNDQQLERMGETSLEVVEMPGFCYPVVFREQQLEPNEFFFKIKWSSKPSQLTENGIWTVDLVTWYPIEILLSFQPFRQPELLNRKCLCSAGQSLGLIN